MMPFLALTVLLATLQTGPVRETVVNRRIQPDQTLGQALHAISLPEAQTSELLHALDGVLDFKKIRPGDQLRLVLVAGELQRFDYRASAFDEWQVRRDGERLVASKREIEIEKRVETIELEVQTSLYEACLASGEDPNIALTLSDVFAWEIDFYLDVRKGDRARAVVEKFMSKNRLLRYGNVLAASYEGSNVGRKRVFRYELPDGTATYFQGDGSSARKSFLKSPLKFAHVTSSFGNRFHPILQYVRAHAGVDYGTPVGTPVWAVANGTVTRSGWEGGGGNVICVRHANGMESCYMHLSRMGVRTGARVQQKQVIAYTGNSGLSTGPHLHYGLKRNGAWVNPLNQNFPRAEPLPKELLPTFKETIGPLSEQLDAVSVASGSRPGRQRIQ